MFEAVKKYKTFIDYANPLTKILLAAILFVMVIFIHNPNVLFHLTMLMLLMLLILSGVKLKYLILLLIFIFISGFISSLYMIFYGEGSETLFRYGIIHITEESFIRGIHITMRGVTLSLFGALVIFTSKITDVFYALMIQLKVKPKYAYSFMAAIRMVPIIITEYFQLRQARKVRRALIHKSIFPALKV
ncbi:energy-coupling factor transporter transmembrane protein EcfT [Jeotgalicoccus sp. WY2]|uniref:energy-coupling factor transporter transmembrane component T family protein n=1 Tax=Jeotgalicoccus sp. WY2 TaxID=2708346 RepID=UPI002022770A|nr:energy-coupling factor transporter transmembrane component T [Jeotgalicoccus sp. WY2]